MAQLSIAVGSSTARLDACRCGSGTAMAKVAFAEECSPTLDGGALRTGHARPAAWLVGEKGVSPVRVNLTPSKCVLNLDRY